MVAVDVPVGVVFYFLLVLFFGDSDPGVGVLVSAVFVGVAGEGAVLTVVFVEEAVEGLEVDAAGGFDFVGDGGALVEAGLGAHLVEVSHWCLFLVVFNNCVLFKV